MYTDPEEMEVVVNLIPNGVVEISDLGQARRIVKLIDILEEHDDVRKVFTNFGLSENLVMEDLQ